MFVFMNRNLNQTSIHSQPQAGPSPGHLQLSHPQALAQSLPHHNAQLSSPAASNPAAGSSANHGNGNSAPGGGKRNPTPFKPPLRSYGAGSSSALYAGQVGTASPLKTMELAPAIRRRKREVHENEIPRKVAASLPESALYTHLLELESRLDALLARKKIEITESLENPPRVQKILRIYVFNTFEGQAGDDTTERKTSVPPSWSLKIFGRILEDGRKPATLGSFSTSYPKFSSFFKKITIYLDQNLYPDNHVILWDKSRSLSLHEGFEVKRKGDKEFNAIIRLEMDFVPEKFRLSAALQEVLGIEVETRARVIAALWHYIRSRKLQIPGDPSSFMCDPPLKKVFGQDSIKFAVVSQRIIQHLTSPEPIHLQHKVKLSGNCPAGNICYDVLVDIPFLSEGGMLSFVSDAAMNEEIEAYDGAISSSIREIHDHCLKRAFFLGFSHSPAEFINALLASQARDLKIAGGDTSRHTENELRSEFYNQSWVEDAVIRYLNRKPAFSNEPSRNK